MEAGANKVIGETLFIATIKIDSDHLTSAHQNVALEVDPPTLGELEHGEDPGVRDAALAVVLELRDQALVRTPKKTTKTKKKRVEKLFFLFYFFYSSHFTLPSNYPPLCIVSLTHPLLSTSCTLLLVSLKLKQRFTRMPNWPEEEKSKSRASDVSSKIPTCAVKA